MAVLYYKKANGEFAPLYGSPKYVLPPASETELGGVKTASVVDSTSTDDTVPTSKATYDGIKKYADKKVADLVGTAPETLDTIEEIATAMQQNHDVVEALDLAIAQKANRDELTAHIEDKNNPHKVTATQVKKEEAIIDFAGKTMRELHDAIKNWWINSNGSLSIFRFQGINGTESLLSNWANPDYLIEPGSNWEISSICDYAPNSHYATFILSTVYADSTIFCQLNLYNDNLLVPIQLLSKKDIATSTDVGLVKPDNTTLSVNVDGVMSVKNIQKVSKTLSTAGWYRVATIGSFRSPCNAKFYINSFWNYGNPESYNISITRAHIPNNISILSASYSDHNHKLTKMRIINPSFSSDEAYSMPCYIDIYYDFSKSNPVTIKMISEEGIISDLSPAEIPEGYVATEYLLEKPISGQEAVDNLEIGGTNLAPDLYNTWIKNSASYLLNSNLIKNDDTSAISGYNVAITATETSTSDMSGRFITFDNWIPIIYQYMGEKVTWSCWVKASIDNFPVRIGLENIAEYTGLISTEWVKIYCTGVIKETPYKSFICYKYQQIWNSEETLYIKDLKIEFGDKATSWSPSSYDLGKSAIGEITTGQTFTVNDTAVVAEKHATRLNDLTYNIATGLCSTAMGASTIATGMSAIATGGGTTSSGMASISAGNRTTASGNYSVALGSKTIAQRACAVAMGEGTIANQLNTVVGKFNKTPQDGMPTSSSGDLFIVGNGTPTTQANAFRVAVDGNVYGTKAYTASGADICHAIEWLDGNPDNEDRRGLFVTLEGDKIRCANTNDTYILGVISSTPSLICNAATDDWSKKWKTDIFGEKLLDENGAWILNEDFREEDNEAYESRLNRKEWAIVGHSGIVIAVDDGTCQVNSYCMPNDDGIATAAEIGYRVMKRLDNTHIEIFISAPAVIKT